MPDVSANRDWGARLRAMVMEPRRRARVTAVTGLLLVGFCLLHAVKLWGLMWWPGAIEPLFDAARRQVWVRSVELALVFVFALHAVLAVGVAIDEHRTDPDRRRLRRPRTLAVTGALLGGFLVWHLTNFRFGIRPDAFGIHDFHGTILALLRRPLPALGYLVAGVTLAVHVRLGLRAAIDAWRPPGDATAGRREAVAVATALLLLVAFAGLPVYVLFWS